MSSSVLAGPEDRRGRGAAADLADLVLVSDRGPVQFIRNGSRLTPKRRSSSVTGLLDQVAVRAGGRARWISPSAHAEDVEAERAGLVDGPVDDLGYRIDLVGVSRARYDAYYYDAGVEVIWRAWHGIEDEIPARAESWSLAALAEYATVNRALATRAAHHAAPKAVVAVQDYQLMAAPAMLRALRPDTRIMHFSHTPFPGTASLSRIPETVARFLVEGMLGADLLGFQRALWSERFMDACRQFGFTTDEQSGWVRNPDGRRTWVRRYPVPVDVSALHDRVRQGRSGVGAAAEQARTGDRRSQILRVDRLDPAKNALRGFEAYSRLLDRRPELASEVHFVACLVPSREQVPAYRRYAERVWNLVDEVNRRHQGAITVYYGDDQSRALRLMRDYDVLLVNPITDGMNLVAQEGPVVNDRNGVVVLSDGAGCGDLLRAGALILDDPRDVHATEAMLERALHMPAAERSRRADVMRTVIGRSSPDRWMEQQLEAVTAAGRGDALPA